MDILGTISKNRSMFIVTLLWENNNTTNSCEFILDLIPVYTSTTRRCEPNT